MSFYLSITDIQPPFDIGVDDNHRNQKSCNFLAKTRGSSSEIAKEIARRIADQTTLTYDPDATDYSGDIYVGLKVDFEGDGPFVRVIETAGLPSNATRAGSAGGVEVYPTYGIQTITVAKDIDVCAARAQAVFDALVTVRNQTLTT